MAWARGLGAMLGRLALLFNVNMVRVTRRNIAYCLGDLTLTNNSAWCAPPC